MNVELDEINKWKALRDSLNQTYEFNNNWEKAIDLFNTRLKRKFFNPIQTLIDTKTLEGEGFTIVTVLCSLIEMLSAFRKGEIYNHQKKRNSPSFEYNQSKIMFTDFLKTASIFKDIFWKIDSKDGKSITNGEFDADDFYTSVRCGLMHEARTKNNWFINAAPKTIKTKTEDSFLNKDGNKKIIYRTVLHYRLLTYLSEYQDELRQTNFEGKILRKYFARKMDHLFEFKLDAKYDWWT